MSFSFVFFGFEEALRGEVPEDTLTIAIKHGEKTTLLGDCFTKDPVGDVIEAIAFAINSCEGINFLRKIEPTVGLFDYFWETFQVIL
ncbi:hypothetical protein PYCH_05740 [Pyrococcus yayanosii CH1]|uniref:Uncharacterized protein n=1 Tax=Pyrococcus yayanosii (strain CH1 / JCM 16557) TaxID=529709 RepID=F8AHX3_PYRYC|nr:hypothetical protein PYCH_05740 [Pyrococcus yayanosii CH1]